MRYTSHSCPSAYKKDVQVPVCPLCNQPVPVGRNQEADAIVGAHMDNDCQSQPAQARRKVHKIKFTKKETFSQRMVVLGFHQQVFSERMSTKRSGEGALLRVPA